VADLNPTLKGVIDVRDSIIFLTKDDILTKVILRQHQVRAIEKVLQRIEGSTKQHGLIWHTQGSGNQYLPYAHANDDKAVERTYQYFLDDKERRETFLTFFRRLQNLYEVLSPSPFLRPYLEDYQALADLYVLVRRDIDAISPDRELTRKTRELLRAHTTSTPLKLPGAIRELGPDELAMLKQSNVSDTIKRLNLRKLLNVTVEERAKYEPHVIPIGERAEAVAKAYEERHIATQEALESYEKLAEQYVHAYEERQKLGLDANAFAIYLQLKQTVPEVTAPRAKVINEAFSRYPDYQWNEQQKVKLRADLYKLLYPLCGVVQSVAIASKLLELERL
jgi:type I restriction enzyme R subunit